MVRFLEYDFEVKHIKVKEKKLVDALSQCVHKLYVTNHSTCESDLNHKIKITLQKDELFLQKKAKMLQIKS